MQLRIGLEGDDAKCMSYKVRASRFKGQDILVVFQNPGPRATMRRKTSRRPTGPGRKGAQVPHLHTYSRSTSGQTLVDSRPILTVQAFSRRSLFT